MDKFLWIKSYVAAAGLFGLAVYQFSQGDYATALVSLGAASAAVTAAHGYAAPKQP